MPELVWGSLAVFLGGLLGGVVFAGVQAARARSQVRPSLARMRAGSRALALRGEAVSQRAGRLGGRGPELERAVSRLSSSLARMGVLLDALEEARPLALALRWLARRP